MNRRKAKEFAKKHKAKIVAGVWVLAGSVVCVIATKKFRTRTKVSIFENKIRDIQIPDGFSVGNVISLFEDGDEIVAIARDLTANDLGAFGEELVKCGIVANGAEAAITAEFLRSL